VALLAGLCLGSGSFGEVEGVYGPGSPGITAAMAAAFSYGKRTVAGIGPTDCVVVADETADARITAYDLCNEAEHGEDSPALLVTDSPELARAVTRHLRKAVEQAPQPRRQILEKVFGASGMGSVVLAPDMDTAVQFVNDFAPEHVMVTVDSAHERAVAAGIHNAGEMLLGPWTPFSAANYAIGITAVLPTNGCARRFSGVTCRDMMKHISTARLDRNALESLLPTIRSIGEHETLPMHVRAATARTGE
jgi:histidinol dehydrogenase